MLSRTVFSSLLLIAITAIFALGPTSISAQVINEIVRPELPGTKAAVKRTPREIPLPAASEAPTLAPEAVVSSNYVFTVATNGSFTDMTGSTQLVGPTQDDTASLITNIGFDFYFMGVRYSQFSVSSNGYLRLGGVVSTTQYTLGAASVSLITAMGSDEFTSTTGKVHYRVTGSAPNRVLTVEFLNHTVIYDGAGATADCTSQVRLYETTGVIELIYGSMTRNSSTGFMGGLDAQYMGFSSNSTSGNFYTVNTADVANSTGSPVGNQFIIGATMASLNSPTDGSRKMYSFTPPTPLAPTSGAVSPLNPTNLTLNWTDNEGNESQYAVYRSTDNVNFSFIASAGANSTSYMDTLLAPGTQYFYRVYAVSEGALSTAATFSPTTPTGNPVSCNGAGGLWNTPGTWSTGSVPNAADNVTIQNGCTVTIDTAAVALSFTVQSGGVLQFDSATGRTLATGFNSAINAGGTLQSATTGTVTTHVLTINGNLTNNGTLDLSTNANTAGATLTFTGAANNTLSGTGATTDLRALTINKGTSNANILEITTSNLTIQGVGTDVVGGFLTLTNGTLKISGTFAVTNRTFTTAAYTIGATTGFWLNNPNFTVAGQNGSPTESGLLRITQGTFNIGTATGNSMGFSTGSTVIVEGGAVNGASRFGVAAAANTLTFTLSGGTITVCTVGNTSTTLGSFDLGTSLLSTISITGGTIVNQLAASAIDYRMQAGNGTLDVTGGTLQLGNAASGAAKAYNLRGVLPNLVITNTSANHSATLSTTLVNFNNISRNITINTGTTFNPGNVVFLFNGATITNNGTLTHNGASSNFVIFSLDGPANYTGTGTVTAPLTALSLQCNQGFTIDPSSSNLTANTVNLFNGNVTNSNKITLGNGGSTTGRVVVGNNTTPTPAGSFDVPLTFNLGTGGQILTYQRTTASRSTGPEINPTRTVTAFTYDENDPTHTLTLAGGDLTVTGATTLTNGMLITNTNNYIVGSAGTVTRTNGFIYGNFRKVFAAAGSKTFEVGTANSYVPVTINATAGTFPAEFTVRAATGTMAGANMSLSLTRSWTLEPNGITAADITLNYLQTDVPGSADENDFQFVRRSGSVMTEFAPSSANIASNVFTLTGVTGFSHWTLGRAAGPTAAGATISGRALSATGLPLARVTVILSGANGQTRTAVTGPFGYYTFTDVEVGQDYVVTAYSKERVFKARLLSVTGAVANFDLIAEP